uniref:T-complex-associated-testis-expressed 1 n=1 Tax=Molossus molossus TaxID=27622 RepID=A0A7J8GU01_MOLMO|nr:t-complex-associated-testis-expressed 1 [Molossus molossus]
MLSGHWLLYPCSRSSAFDTLSRTSRDNPILKQLPARHQQKVLNNLSPDLPLAVTANLIDDENYWHRCCVQRWPVCHLDCHGGSWKCTFFEKHLENLIKHFIPGTTDPAVILDLLPLCRNYVHRIRVDQFLPPVQLPPPPHSGDQSDSGSEGEMEEPTMDHYQLGDLVAGLSQLVELDLVYGVKDCGMNFEWNLFLFTYRDCHSLAATIKACHTLKIFRLTQSKVDDDKARILIRSLLDHPALEELDLSHNCIGDRGARAAAKLLSHSHLRVLNLANNQDGGKQLLEGMSDNRTLLDFDLRLSDVAQESEYLIGQALCANREEARQRALNASHFMSPLTATGPENPEG